MKHFVFRKWALALGRAAFLALATAGGAAVLNDGTTITNLARLSNENETGAATLQLEPANGVLHAQQTGVVGNIPMRTAWFASAQAVTGSVYSVSADFRPAENNARNRGGAMGWLNLGTKAGIGLKIVPGDQPYFEVTVVQFAAGDPDTNESFTNLYHLDGTAATDAITSARADASNYNPDQMATLQLEFVPLTASDRQLTNVAATAHLVARVWQTANGASNNVGRAIELLTNLPLPASPRVGYFAYLGSVFVDGPIGDLDNLTAAGGLTAVPNEPPTVVLTRPATNSVFQAPVDIVLEAQASDADGEIMDVTFYANNSLIGAALRAPYSLVWTNPAASTYSVRAVARDLRGASVSTPAITVTVLSDAPADPPPLSITRSGASVTISWPPAYTGYHVQVTTNVVSGPWSDLAATAENSVTRAITGVPREFYRLAR